MPYYRWYSGGFYVEIQAASEAEARSKMQANTLITALDSTRDGTKIFVCGNANYSEKPEVREE